MVFGALTATRHHREVALFCSLPALSSSPPHARNLVLALKASGLYLGMAGGTLLGGFVLQCFGAAALPLVSALVTAAVRSAFLITRYSGHALVTHRHADRSPDVSDLYISREQSDQATTCYSRLFQGPQCGILPRSVRRAVVGSGHDRAGTELRNDFL